MDYFDDDPAAVAAEAERRAADEKALAEKKGKRSPPRDFEASEIKKARRRTKTRHPAIAMHLEDVGEQRSVFSCHSDDEGHSYRLVDAFGTRSFAFVCSMLEGLADVTADHSENFGHTPGKSNEAAFNAALAVIAGVQLLRSPAGRLIPPKRTSDNSSLVLGEQRLELSDCALDLLAEQVQDWNNRPSGERANSLKGDVHVRLHFQFEFGLLF
jgi:hypothetical protein